MVKLAELLRVQPLPPGVLPRGLPGAAAGEEHLLRQVMALANADLEGVRCLLYGVEHGAAGAPAVIGLGEADMARIHAQRDACLAAIEPPLELAVVTGDVAGKTVAALMLMNCLDTPYVAGEHAPAPLRPGECWLFDAQGMRPATRADLDALYATRRHRRGEVVLVGVGEDPRCECLQLSVPDAANPPSRAVALKLRAAVAAKKTATAVMGREDTDMGRLAHARIYGPDIPFRQRSLDTLARSLETVADDYRDADLHYHYEQRAVRLNMAVLNAGSQTLKGTVVEITLPEVPGFTVAPRLYPAPGAAAAGQYYPEVRREAGCIRVRSALGDLAPEGVRPVFTTALRLAVARALVGHKIAIRYALVAENLSSPVSGRLRVKFTR